MQLVLNSPTKRQDSKRNRGTAEDHGWQLTLNGLGSLARSMNETPVEEMTNSKGTENHANTWRVSEALLEKYIRPNKGSRFALG